MRSFSAVSILLRLAPLISLSAVAGTTANESVAADLASDSVMLETGDLKITNAKTGQTLFMDRDDTGSGPIGRDDASTGVSRGFVEGGEGFSGIVMGGSVGTTTSSATTSSDAIAAPAEASMKLASSTTSTSAYVDPTWTLCSHDGHFLYRHQEYLSTHPSCHPVFNAYVEDDVLRTVIHSQHAQKTDPVLEKRAESSERTVTYSIIPQDHIKDMATLAISGTEAKAFASHGALLMEVWDEANPNQQWTVELIS